MPFVTFDDTISGVDSVDLGGNRVLYFAWLVTVDGRKVRSPSSDDPTQLAGVGFIQFGNDITSGGILSGDAWQPPYWLNSRQGQIIANPQDQGGGFGRIIASRLHYAISPETEVHLYVLGDNV